MVSIKQASEIRKAKKYSDLFSSDKAIAKKEFREYCKLYHPDVSDTAESHELMGIIMEIYNGHQLDSVNSSTTKERFRFTNKATGKGFELQNPFIFSNGICMVYHTATKVALVYDKSYEKFYKNYLSNVSKLTYPDDKMRKEFERYFPKIVTHFETTTGKYCILLDKTSEVINLGVVVDSYKRKGEQVPDRQAAWMINRLYNMMCYMHFSKKVFNGLSLYNIWVSPEMHTLLLFTGWEYTMPKGVDMIGCPKEVYSMLPVKIKDTHESSTETDLECIKYIGRMLFKGSSAENIKKFMNAGTDNLEPLEVWREYEKALKADYGKRTFVIWDDVPYNI